MQKSVMTLGDYLQILRRRKGLFIASILVLMLIAISISISLPTIYQSSATILIEKQEIPQDLVRSTISTYADQRLQVINQRVMSNANLAKIIRTFNLYPQMTSDNTITVVLDRMREDILMEMISAEVVDPRSGRPTQATIAFKLSYENSSPELAQKVTNEIASLYLSENIKTRTEKTKETHNFLSSEAEKLKSQIQDIEKKLASFKEKNVGRLPELVDLNIQLMGRAEREIIEVDSRLHALLERKAYLESQLTQINPNVAMFTKTGERILGAEDRLKSLRAVYPTLVASYTPQHPEVIRTRKEIDELETLIGDRTNINELESQLNEQKNSLAALRDKYSLEHPDVQKLNLSILYLEKAIKEANRKSTNVIKTVSKPDNPAYIQLMAQLQAVNTEIQSFRNQRVELKNKMSDLEERLLDTPQVEREYRGLIRDYENTNARYQEIKSKQMSAQLGEQLEKVQKGERLSIIEPPLLPEEPIKPNRKAILFLGFILSISGGLGAIAVAENINQSIHGRGSVERLLGMQPIAIIPYIQVGKKKNFKNIYLLISLLVMLSIVLLAVHLMYVPLDVLWYTGLREMGL